MKVDTLQFEDSIVFVLAVRVVVQFLYCYTLAVLDATDGVRLMPPGINVLFSYKLKAVRISVGFNDQNISHSALE